MENYIIIKNKDILLLNFESIFKEIQIDFLEDCSYYKFFSNGKICLGNFDCKKFLYHHTIYNICENVIKNKKTKRVVIFIPEKLNKNNEIFSFCDYDKFNILYFKFLKKLSKILPIIFIKYDDYYINPFEEMEDYVEEEFLNYLNSDINDHENQNFTFKNIKKLCSRYELKFLTEDYFQKLRSKQLLY